MAELARIITDFTAFIDGVGMAGRVAEGQLPKIALQTEKLRAGGMGGSKAISMEMLEDLEAMLTMEGLSADFTKMIGDDDGQLTLRGAISNGGSTQAAIFQMRGLFSEAEFGAMKRGDKGSTKLKVDLNYFKATIGGVEVLEVSIFPKMFKVHGVDRFAESRAALGG